MGGTDMSLQINKILFSTDLSRHARYTFNFASGKDARGKGCQRIIPKQKGEKDDGQGSHKTNSAEEEGIASYTAFQTIESACNESKGIFILRNIEES
jgi:hypothetical protein